MPQHKQVDKVYWAEALLTFTYLKDLVTSCALPNNKTHHQLWKGHAPTLSRVRVFGPKCWYLVLAKGTQKFGNKSPPSIFIGYSDRNKAFRLLDIETRKLIICKGVVFDEASSGTRPFRLQPNDVLNG